MSATSYAPLSSKTLEAGVGIARPDYYTNELTLADPALAVMTDLSRVPAITVSAQANLAAAEQRMKWRGVRMLLVLDEDERVIGLLTLTDIQGEKPMQIIQSQGGKHGDLLIRDIMVPQSQIDVLCLPDVEKARIGDVVATLKQSGRQHALVVERKDDRSPQVLRGIFSAAQIGRQLHMDLEHTEFASSFAEIEALLKVA